MAAINPFDFFVDEDAVRWPFTYEASLAQRSERLPGAIARLRRCWIAISTTVAASEPVGTIDFITGLNRDPQPAHRVSHPHGAGRANARGDAGEPVGLVPRHRLVAGQAPASPRPRGALRVRLSHPAPTGRKAVVCAEAPRGRGGGLCGPARLGRGLHSRRRLDRSRSDIRPAHRARATFRWRQHRRRPVPRPSPVRTARHRLDFSVSMRVQRLHETPRVSAPYNDEQWQAMLAAGAAVEDRLNGRAMCASAWAASRPSWRWATARPRNGAPLPWGRPSASTPTGSRERLCARFASGGLLHYGQGKWYPGEQTARWAFGIYWRTDGAPLWRDAGLIAEENADPPSIADAQAFAKRAVPRRSACPTTAPYRPMRTPRTSCLRSRGCRPVRRRRAIRSPTRPNVRA